MIPVRRMLAAVGGVPLAFVAYAAFAFSDAAVRVLDGALSPYQVAFTGALLGLLALPLVCMPEDRLVHMFAATRRSLWFARALASAIGAVSSVIAFSRLPMPEAFALLFLMPLFVTVLSVLVLHEKVGPWRWAAVLLGFAGVMLILRPGLRTLDEGHIAALVGAVASAVVIILFRVGGEAEKRVSMLGAGLTGALLLNGVLMIPDLRWPDAREIALLLAYGLLAIVGQTLLMIAAQRTALSRIAPPQYSQMIWAVGLSYLVFHEAVDALSLFGIAVIIAAGLLTWAREQIRLPSWRRRVGLRPR